MTLPIAGTARCGNRLFCKHILLDLYETKSPLSCKTRLTSIRILLIN